MSANQDENPTTTIIKNISNHPTSVITDNTIYEYIHRDYFVDPKNQERNNTWRNTNVEKWDKLKKKLSEEILDYLKNCMIAEAKKQKIKVRKKCMMVDVCRWSDIGTSFKQYSSVEIARKMNIITKPQFSSDNKMEQIIMNKYALKYIAEKDDTTTKSCVTRLITQTNSYLVSYFYIIYFIYFITY